MKKLEKLFANNQVQVLDRTDILLKVKAGRCENTTDKGSKTASDSIDKETKDISQGPGLPDYSDKACSVMVWTGGESEILFDGNLSVVAESTEAALFVEDYSFVS
jgi:hypothetical protein